MKYLVLIAALFLGAASASATIIPASSCSVADITTANGSASAGDTISVPSCALTHWASAPTITTGVSLQGATVCTGTGDYYGGTSGVITCTDNTNISLDVDPSLSMTGSSTHVSNITGFTFTANVSSSNGTIRVNGTSNLPAVHIHGNHFIMANAGSVVLAFGDSNAVIDHNFFDDQVPSGSGAVPLRCLGDFATRGYQDWNDATVLGSAVANYIEQNYYATTHTNSEGFFDGYYGCKIVVRFNTISGNELGGYHGADTGYPWRSGVLGEYYGNHIDYSANLGAGVMNPRGGITMYWDNVLPNASGASTVLLEYLRYPGSSLNVNASPWGLAGAGLNWIIPSLTPSSWDDNSLLESGQTNAYQQNHSYSALATATLSGCNVQTAAGGTTSSSTPACPGTLGGTVTDSGGVVWTQVGGKTAASTLSVAGWCAANPDTYASADSTCNALSPGDTASAYLDTGNTGCPYRDFPGCGHNQQFFGNYAFLNTKNGSRNTVFSTPSGTSGIIVANSNYYDDLTGAGCSGTQSTGVCSGTLASKASNCTTGVAYFATDQGSWNVSGNGFGSGVLYKCTATNTWTSYYTPYIYPHPLDTTASQAGGVASGVGLASGTAIKPYQ